MAIEGKMSKRAIQREMRDVVETIKIEKLPETELQSVQKSALELLSQRHHFAGLAVNEPKPVMLLRLPDSARDDILNLPLQVIPYGWPGKFGASLTLTCYYETAIDARARIAIPQSNSATLELLWQGRVTLVMVRGQKPLAAYQVDFTANASALDNIRRHVASVRDHVPQVFAEPDAHYWETLQHQHVFERHYTRGDFLSVGWFEAFEKTAQVTQNWLTSLKANLRLPKSEEMGSFPPRVASLVEACTSASDAASLVSYLRATFRTTTELAKFVGDWFTFAPQVLSKWEEAAHFISHVLNFHLLLSDSTECGKQVFWYDFRSRDFSLLELDAKNFPVNANPQEYWPRIPWDVINFARGIGLNGADFPISKSALIESRDKLPIALDSAAVSASADALLEEAVANKLGTIPPKACVDLAFGPFDYLEITECDPHVFFVCRNSEGEFFQVTVEPHNNYCSFRMPDDDEKYDSDLAEKIEAGVKLLLAAMVRDFWVIEHREAVFDCRTSKTPGGAATSDDDRPRIVYVPRIRYTANPDSEKCAEELAHTARRAHFVRGFVRRTKSPSTHQLVLAQRYGIEVPQGYTFVRPHERGKAKRDVIYRSRSALQCMYTATEPLATAHPSE